VVGNEAAHVTIYEKRIKTTGSAGVAIGSARWPLGADANSQHFILAELSHATAWMTTGTTRHLAGIDTLRRSQAAFDECIDNGTVSGRLGVFLAGLIAGR